MRKSETVPSRSIYMIALLDALRANGGSARSEAVYDYLIRTGIARESDRTQLQRSGETRFAKEVRFARKELVDAGLLLNGAPGLWTLSSEGWRAQLTPADIRELMRRRRQKLAPTSFPHAVVPFSLPTPSTGPAPVEWTGTISRRCEGEAWTYIMRYGNSDVWKVGYAINVEARLIDINTHIPVEITRCQWMHFARHPWASPALAYRVEQSLLAALAQYRTSGERVQCSEAELLTAWHAIIESFVSTE